MGHGGKSGGEGYGLKVKGKSADAVQFGGEVVLDRQANRSHAKRVSQRVAGDFEGSFGLGD
jgi:hypothetical protein